MVKVTCIDDSKPEGIISSEWIKKGEEYHITFVSWHPLQKEAGCLLYEKELTEKSSPYEYYLLKRFSIIQEELLKLLELIKECNNLPVIDMNEFIKSTELEFV